MSDIDNIEDSFLHVQHKNKDGSMHYDGVLGSFDYDTSMFELHTVDVPETEHFPAGQYEVLRYIGNESDGNKIKIPEGITNTSFMFMNSGINSMPKIPDGVEIADSMFSGCELMRVADKPFPSSLNSANFMFFGCGALDKGPDLIPGTVKDTNFMFGNCAKLKNTPRLLSGIENGEFMFCNCASLTDAPKIPSTMNEYSGMTYRCDGMDAKTDASNEAKMAQKRASLESKLDRNTFIEKVGSGFGAIMQCHALRQAGYGFIMAPIMTHIMRKNGSFDKSLSGGLAVSSVRRGGLTGVLLGGLAGKINKHGEKQRAKSAEKLDQFDRMNANVTGTNRTQSMRVMAVADKDVESGLFSRVQGLSETEKMPYRARFGGNYDVCEKVMGKVFDMSKSTMNPKEKHAISEWYQKEVAACAAYYGEAKRTIKAKYKSGPEYDKAMVGLDEVSKMQLEPLLNSVEYVQDKYHLFNDGDIRNIARMVQDMPSEKNKAANFATRMVSGVDIQDSMMRQKMGFMKSQVVPKNEASNERHFGSDSGQNRNPSENSARTDNKTGQRRVPIGLSFSHNSEPQSDAGFSL